jgi:hypothetical protein
MGWHDLEPILRRDGIARDAPHLVGLLRTAVEAASVPSRQKALAAIATTLTANGDADRFIRSLAHDMDPVARRLALDLMAHLQNPPDRALISTVRPILRDRRIAIADRLAAAISLFQAARPATAERVLRDFAAGFGHGRFLRRRSTLRKRFVKGQRRRMRRVFDRFTARMAGRVRFGCPKCGAKLPRKEMSRHLWERHRLVLSGGRVHLPWRMIDHWAAGEGGSPANAHRRLLRLGGAADDPSLAALREDADRSGAGLCPHCFALLSLDQATFPAADDFGPLTLSHGRLAGHGFALGLRNSLIGPRLRVETPRSVVYNGPAPALPTKPRPSHRWSVFPFVLVAIVAATVLPPSWALATTLVSLLFAVFVMVRLHAGEPDDRPDQVVDHAWQLVVPGLRLDEAGCGDADFLAGLAITSMRFGDSIVRDKPLQRAVVNLTAAVRAGTARPAHLAALQRLQIADAEQVGGDPVVAAAAAVGPCLAGELTPAAASLILTNDLIGDWARGELARLRILLVARAFAAGLGVWDVIALGSAVPALGRVLHSDDVDGLARLRILWDSRGSRPWKQCGPAATAFELAKYPMLGGQHLEAAPDLLLFQPLPAGGDPVYLLACGRGLIIGGQLIHDWPTRIESRPLPRSKGGGYEVRFGPNTVQIHSSPSEFVRRIEVWADYLFGEFLPWIGNALTRPGDGSPGQLTRLTVTCPECRTAFLGRRGGPGRRLDAGDAIAEA